MADYIKPAQSNLVEQTAFRDFESPAEHLRLGLPPDRITILRDSLLNSIWLVHLGEKRVTVTGSYVSSGRSGVRWANVCLSHEVSSRWGKSDR